MFCTNFSSFFTKLVTKAKILAYLKTIQRILEHRSLTQQLLQFTKTLKKSGKITCTPNRNLPSRRTQKFFLFEKILSPPTTISRHNRLQFYEICEINKNFFQFFSSFTYSNTQLVKKFPSTLLNVGRPKLVKTHQLDWRMIQGLIVSFTIDMCRRNKINSQNRQNLRC